MVRLNPNVRSSFINGEFCPPNDDYKIVFRLFSPVAGISKPSVSFKVNSTTSETKRYEITVPEDPEA